MAEFDVTLSAVSEAATNIANYTETFREEADATYQAAKTLSEGWEGDASQTFVENMEQLHQWMNEMAATLETYSAQLNKARATCEEADRTATGNFEAMQPRDEEKTLEELESELALTNELITQLETRIATLPHNDIGSIMRETMEELLGQLRRMEENSHRLMRLRQKTESEGGRQNGDH